MNRRFGERWDEKSTDILSNYLYHISAAPHSGEVSIQALLQVVISKWKGYSSIYSKRSNHLDLQETISKHKIPVLLLYGDKDWLYTRNVKTSVEEMIQKEQNMSTTDKNFIKNNLTLDFLKDSGHHLYMDNLDAFHGALDSFLVKHKTQLEQKEG